MKLFLKYLPIGLSLLGLSACMGDGLPKCGSDEAEELITEIINERRYQLCNFVELRSVEEVGHNKSAELRTCSAELITTKSSESIYYSIKWVNQNKEEFWLEIN